GIVRFVSALFLGVACGLARQATASVAPPMLVHVAFNALSLATARRLVVTDAFPMKDGAPTLVALAGAIAAWAAALHFLLVRRGKRPSG
ncbi:MAG TPA: CPBP family glutamic-type intramembrane protease, partial [Polyangiaceae bacterium]|nr:CPBP family glutamic-type intramembrane protease [Polyangiaceae bacterium]